MIDGRNYVEGNPAMQAIYDEALIRMKNEEALAPVQRVVVNEILTRVLARISELELANIAKLEKQTETPKTLEHSELEALRDQLQEGLKRA